MGLPALRAFWISFRATHSWLKNPPPEVLFEDFGNDALAFSLYFWLDVRSGTPARQVASDLRAMIEAGFSAQGIAIPYPQRDVHLDTTRPLQVELTRRPS